MKLIKISQSPYLHMQEGEKEQAGGGKNGAEEGPILGIQKKKLITILSMPNLIKKANTWGGEC